jgi:molybdopterin converting factor small subunit
MKLNSTLGDMLIALVNKYGDDFARYLSSSNAKKGLQPVFLINGQDARWRQGFKTTLHNGDTVALIPPIAGGYLEPYVSRAGSS